MRIGLGIDVHKFVSNRKLILGGVEIPYEFGLEGHSDADVLIHAIMDSLLGAASLGDIGKLFPDSDSKYKDIDSMLLLKIVREKIEQAGYKIINIDTVVVAQKPKISKYTDEMRKRISEVLKIDMANISIKGTTTEYLGFTGRGEGIAAFSNCLLEKLGG